MTIRGAGRRRGGDEPRSPYECRRGARRGARTAARDLGVDIRQSTMVETFKAGDHSIAVTLGGREIIEARLLVACDGVRSRLRRRQASRPSDFDYGHGWRDGRARAAARGHGGGAFPARRPVCDAALKNNRSSLVWTERTADAERLVASDDLVFEEELERRFGHELGTLKVVGGRRAFPLGLTLARDFVAPRFALASDAAHGIHTDLRPRAQSRLGRGGAGRNHRRCRPAGARHRLAFGARALPDMAALRHVAVGVTTDVLDTGCFPDITPVRALRDFGLGSSTGCRRSNPSSSARPRAWSASAIRSFLVVSRSEHQIRGRPTFKPCWTEVFSVVVPD